MNTISLMSAISGHTTNLEDKSENTDDILGKYSTVDPDSSGDPLHTDYYHPTAVEKYERLKKSQKTDKNSTTSSQDSVVSITRYRRRKKNKSKRGIKKKGFIDRTPSPEPNKGTPDINVSDVLSPDKINEVFKMYQIYLFF